MFPKGLIITIVTGPVRVDVAQSRGTKKLGDNISNVGIRSTGVTVCRISSVTVVRPKTVNGPRICVSVISSQRSELNWECRPT